MLAYVYSSTVFGIDAYLVKVEVDIASGLPSFSTVGLPDAAVKESKDRVVAAIRNSGFDFPVRKITVNLAPADIKKEGAAFDLPIALGILAATEQLRGEKLKKYCLLGELSLDGNVREVKGILPIALKVSAKSSAKSGENLALHQNGAGLEGIILPKGNRAEAAVVEGIKVIPVENLAQVVKFLQGEIEIEPFQLDLNHTFEEASSYEVDFREVKGQEFAKRALEVAAAGSHNCLMIGPPGSGKTMLSKRLPTILPPLTLEEAIETTKIHSVTGLIPRYKALVATRPFRSPHHTISDIALIGGGTYPKPGEVSLANNGVLFLDELPEFHRNVLEVLRQPMEEGQVTISRAVSAITYPARFTLVCAMNPCPCGYFGHPIRECTCTPFQIQKYMNRISGPLLDRIDIHIEVPALKVVEITSDTGTSESSETIRQRVVRARKIQQERYKEVTTPNEKRIYANAHLTPKLIKKYCPIDKEGENLLKNALERLGLSARAYDRILKVARTIADLEDGVSTPGQELISPIKPEHLAEAIQYRSLDRSFWV